MSHRANIYCLDCKKENDVDFSYNDECLVLGIQSFVKNYLFIRQIEEGTGHTLRMGFYVERLNEIGDFLRKHIDHNIVIRSEYNYENKYPDEYPDIKIK